jgi:hypothetical protein
VEKRKSDIRYQRVPLCPKLADIRKSIASAIYQLSVVLSLPQVRETETNQVGNSLGTNPLTP